MDTEEAFAMGLSDYGKLLEEAGSLEREGKGKVEEAQVGVLKQALQYRAEGIVYGSEVFVEKLLSRLPQRRRRRLAVGGFLLA